ncbi:MAG: hypothetical protein IJ762_04255 [Bacteroidaceae bacterium]|nr:hypothetical protein [Bacteroidaceae bacterium]MBR1788390.1 hypothetical protein [Bacteroidaceae bacterium]
MQQLTLQFEGFAPMGRTIDAKAPAREVQVVATKARVINQAKERARTWLRAHREQLEEYAMATALMGTGTFVLYMAAVLQGGAV